MHDSDVVVTDSVFSCMKRCMGFFPTEATILTEDKTAETVTPECKYKNRCGGDGSRHD